MEESKQENQNQNAPLEINTNHDDDDDYQEPEGLQKEGSHLLSPKFRKSSKYGIFGNFEPKGGDQVRPPDLVYSYIADLFIVGPSAYVLLYT